MKNTNPLKYITPSKYFNTTGDIGSLYKIEQLGNL